MTKPHVSKRVVTFGELLLRLCPDGEQRFLQADRYNAFFGGAEANVSVLLANLGMQPVFVSRLPDHQIGQAGINALRKYGVDTGEILRGGNRMGLYFLEQGASQRPSRVIYDRADSAFALSDPFDYDWGRILRKADWFHFSGITPALSDKVAAACMDAVRTAAHLGVPVSCDLNYRQALWSKEKARKVLEPYMAYLDLLIANEEHIKTLFDIHSENIDPKTGELTEAGIEELAAQLVHQYGLPCAAITMRRSIHAQHNRIRALLLNQKQAYFSKEYDIHISDRVGSGDSFSGGLIYALLQGFFPSKAVEFAAAACCLKHTIPGDFCLISAEEICRLCEGAGSGQIQR